MNLDKIDNITKLENASNSVEKQFFVNLDYSDKTITNLVLTGHVFRKCNFYSSKLFNCTFIKCEFLDCIFEATDLLDVKFKDCTLSNCNFTDAKLNDFSIEGGFKSDCNFDNIEIINNVTGISDNENNIISDSESKREKNLNKGASAFCKKLNKIDSANNFVKGKDEYSLQIENTALIIAKDPEFGNKTWRVMVEVNDEIIYSDTVNENISITDLQTEIYNVLELAKEKCTLCILDIDKIKQLLNLEQVIEESEESATDDEITTIEELREYIDQKFDILFQILNTKLK